VSNTKFLAGNNAGLLAGVERVILQGGAAANRLDASGFTGSAVLDGGAGNDTLIAGRGRSILIGGLGVDTLTGGSQQDILIGGTLKLNILQPAFVLLLDKWAGPGSYAARLAALRNGTGLPAGLKLTPATVPDDKAVDTLFGGGDQDWFWSYSRDVLRDKAANETVG
jgi:Ca2+-binding RTX toxin-like protein